jgi:polyhydroxybutyrate depolymerase
VSEFNVVADQANFIVLYPEGLGRSWNNMVKDGYAVINNVDDLGFVREMLSDLDTFATIDPKRIFAAGFCGGAALSYRLACEMSETFAAIGAVSGGLVYSPCQPKEAVSLIHVHGLADTEWPYTGGTSYDFPHNEQVIATWLQLVGCTDSPQVEKLENIGTHTTYAPCQAGTAVELYTIDGLYHSWPAEYEFPVSQIMWDFFASHPKP